MENKIKFKDANGSLLCFIETEKGQIEITKNNYQDVSVLTIENILLLRSFLDDFIIDKSKGFTFKDGQILNYIPSTLKISESSNNEK